MEARPGEEQHRPDVEPAIEEGVIVVPAPEGPLFGWAEMERQFRKGERITSYVHQRTFQLDKDGNLVITPIRREQTDQGETND